jgi:hypothetical protein
MRACKNREFHSHIFFYTLRGEALLSAAENLPQQLCAGVEERGGGPLYFFFLYSVPLVAFTRPI